MSPSHADRIRLTYSVSDFLSFHYRCKLDEFSLHGLPAYVHTRIKTLYKLPSTQVQVQQDDNTISILVSSFHSHSMFII